MLCCESSNINNIMDSTKYCKVMFSSLYLLNLMFKTRVT
jgi:hypothetical protein